MRLLLIILPILILALQANGQKSNTPKAEELGQEIAKIKQLESMRGEKYIDVKQVAGSPYLYRNFVSASILKTKGVEIKDMLLRYNIYNDDMEFKKDGKVLSIAFPSEIYKIRMDGKIFIYTPYMTERKVSAGYFQLLYEGKYHLLKKYEMVLKKPEALTQPNDSTRFVSTTPHYYLQYGDGMVHLIDTRKKLIRYLQPIPQEIVNQIQSSKTKINDEKWLIGLLENLE
jgi:hypothetical protein